MFLFFIDQLSDKISVNNDRQANFDREHAEAWVGDAILALYVREWILANDGQRDGEKFVRFTSNDFLRCYGNPTATEAEIGRIYKAEGQEAAFAWIEAKLLPIFKQREKNYQRMLLERKGRKKK